MPLNPQKDPEREYTLGHLVASMEAQKDSTRRIDNNIEKIFDVLSDLEMSNTPNRLEKVESKVFEFENLKHKVVGISLTISILVGAVWSILLKKFL